MLVANYLYLIPKGRFLNIHEVCSMWSDIVNICLYPSMRLVLYNTDNNGTDNLNYRVYGSCLSYSQTWSRLFSPSSTRIIAGANNHSQQPVLFIYFLITEKLRWEGESEGEREMLKFLLKWYPQRKWQVWKLVTLSEIDCRKLRNYINIWDVYYS